MNNLKTNIKLHVFQAELLGKLTKCRSANFNELLIEGLESEHMNYHLKKLVAFGLVNKVGSKYSLSDAGKDYSNLMDDEVKQVEKQPKTSVLLHAIRVNEKGEVEHLLNRRLKQPFLGKVGRLTGKVRFGEKLLEAAARELYEETGLAAKVIELEQIYHRLRYRENNVIVQDVLFYVFFMKDFTGSFIKCTPHQENFWLTRSELENNSNIDSIDGLTLDSRIEPNEFSFNEELAVATGY